LQNVRPGEVQTVYYYDYRENIINKGSNCKQNSKCLLNTDDQ